ncbi:cell division protein FtsZ [Roseomonas sp. OT10]|uniref:cell division protein FtsZ n=1 Tax=Roseomonas cutis TaxID=2897332 RepID=UPI001E5FE52B|nr:cell division protein FtsZ [Roseomonas sp. OT10]UFN47418.1 cell division protein FtsZ [Roseomonas sp. OT10]
MTLNLTMPRQQHTDFSPRITVVGVGGAGCNAVNNMIAMGLDGVEFLVTNTDAQALVNSRAERRVQLGPHLTQGLGAGAKPEIGRAAAEEATEDLARHLEGVHMVFITAGMGGGTGTGAAPVIARMARERGVLTVGVVTKPFDFEGPKRKRAADMGLEELQQYVDTLIVIPNQNLFRKANERTTFAEAFKMADDVLYMGVRGVTDLMVNPGLVNLDFADIRTVMAEMGKAMMGTGEAEGDDRAVKAAEAAISNPLLEDTSMRGARGVLINITGGWDMTLFEVDEAANRIRREVDEEANIIFGSSVDETMNGRLRVSVVATGIDAAHEEAEAEAPKVVAIGGGAPVQAVSAHAAPAAQPATAGGFLRPGFGRPVGLTPTGPGAGAPMPATPSGPVTIGAPVAGHPVSPAPVRLPIRRAATVTEAPLVHDEPVGREETGHDPVPTPDPVLRGPAAAPRPSAMGSQPTAAGGSLNRLFRQATGLMKRQLGDDAGPQTAPLARPMEPQAAPRAAAPAETGLDIPAFLRRQKN